MRSSRPGVDRFEFDEGVRLSVDLHLCKAALRLIERAHGLRASPGTIWSHAHASRFAEELGPDLAP